MSLQAAMSWNALAWWRQSSKSPAETELRKPVTLDQTMTNWSGLGYGKGASSVA